MFQALATTLPSPCSCPQEPCLHPGARPWALGPHPETQDEGRAPLACGVQTPSPTQLSLRPPLGGPPGLSGKAGPPRSALSQSSPDVWGGSLPARAEAGALGVCSELALLGPHGQDPLCQPYTRSPRQATGPGAASAGGLWKGLHGTLALSTQTRQAPGLGHSLALSAGLAPGPRVDGTVAPAWARGLGRAQGCGPWDASGHEKRPVSSCRRRCRSAGGAEDPCEGGQPPPRAAQGSGQASGSLCIRSTSVLGPGLDPEDPVAGEGLGPSSRGRGAAGPPGAPGWRALPAQRPGEQPPSVIHHATLGHLGVMFVPLPSPGTTEAAAAVMNAQRGVWRPL